MYTRIVLVVLFVLALVGCAGSPQPGMAEALASGPVLGITTDENLRVVSFDYGSAAEKAGVQIGDVLIDLTWIPTEEAVAEGIVTPIVEASQASNLITTPITNGEVITLFVGLPPAPVPVDDFIEHETVVFTDVFTDTQRIIYLASYGVPLRLKVMRDGQEVEIVVIPTPHIEPLPPPGESVVPEITPIPDKYYYY